MKSDRFVNSVELAALAKQFRLAAGRTRAQAAREFGIKQPSIFYAEESPEKPFDKLRCRMIEAYSNLKVTGGYYRLEEH